MIPSRFSLLLIATTALVHVISSHQNDASLSLPRNDVDDDTGFFIFHGDYTPPSPHPPPPIPHPPSLTCEEGLGGTGSLNTLCQLDTSMNFTYDVYIEGNGSLAIANDVVFTCPLNSCSIIINMTKNFNLGENATIIAGSVRVQAYNVSLGEGSLVNVTGLGGDPPEETSGTPPGVQGSGGGHGGRGASCVVDNTKLVDDEWGGDTYAWADLHKPTSYGSRGGTTSQDEWFGGGGGGRIRIEVVHCTSVDGNLVADGGDGGVKGGGGSGGSVYILAHRMDGSGNISACGGNGFAGGGGGRVSVDVFSRHDNVRVFVHGGRSFGCPENSGAAGTYFDAVPRSLIISNDNLTTTTDTLLLEFPKQPLWTNVYVRDHAKASVPLFWSQVQVRGQISLSCGAVLSFGLAHYSSIFELMAEELLMSDSVVKIYGALRMSVKIHLMWKSKMLINGGQDSIVSTSLLEASNLVVLKESSVIHSNANLGMHGQGFLNLSGPGDIIEAQRLILSLFFSINVGSGSVLRGPLVDSSDDDMAPRLYCELQDCPRELIHPPEDCNLNSSLAFTLQVCRVEDVFVGGTIQGSVVHFHWVRTLLVNSSGMITASGLGCTGGFGRGKTVENGLGSGGGHGGKGGDAYYNGGFVEGGIAYGDAKLPCELGSGSGNRTLAGSTTGGGIIVMGSIEHALSSLVIYGSVRADGESFGDYMRGKDGMRISNIGPGGGSGGTILLFLHSLALGNSSTISATGGHGRPDGSGGGGGGRVHFHWSDIALGDKYLPIASANGSILTGGGYGRGQGHAGMNGTVTGKACPKGLYGIFCEQCPVGTFKNSSGSDRALCHNCPSNELPARAVYVPVRGGVTERPCPFECVSDRYHLPNCYTALEEVVYTFGGPWLFSLILLGLLVLLSVVLRVARMKFVAGDEPPALLPAQPDSRIDHSFPFLESLNEVLETNRTEESRNHVYRMYFLGPNSFSEPWHLPRFPPEQVIEIVYEDAFNRFVDEINGLAAYQWWEGSIYNILSFLAYPLAWSWLQQRRKTKLQQLRDFVRSEYDHSCLRSCRSRALYEGLKVASTSDLMLAYVDFFLGGDEKRADLPPNLYQRFPMSLVFGGDGSYVSPFSLQSDNIITCLMSQSVPPTVWYRLVAGLNAQLRLVQHRRLKTTFGSVISWLETHANPTLNEYGIRVDLAWFQPSSSGYCQYGLVVCAIQNLETLISQDPQSPPEQHKCLPKVVHKRNRVDHVIVSEHLITSKRAFGGILHLNNLVELKTRSGIFHSFSCLLCNTRPVGHQDVVGMIISVLLLGDISLVLLIFLQMYSILLLNFLLVLFVLPLGLLFPFPAGITALFSHGPRRSAGLARLYALWSVTSLINVAIAFICGLLHYKSHSSKNHLSFQSWNFSKDESEWWMLPMGLAFCKILQTQLINRHVANQEIQDHSLYSNDPDVFWQS